MNITAMTQVHVPRVAELEKCCISHPWSLKSIASELNNPLALWLVAEEAGEVVGYIGSQSVPPEADVMNVAVSPDHRRKGIAEALVNSLWTQLTERGMSSLTLEVRAANAPAIALYHKLGFVQVGLRKNYYRDPKEDALILQKRL